MDKILSVLFYLSDFIKAESPDPVLATLKRAQRGAILGSFGAFILIALIQFFAPAQAVLPIGSTLGLVHSVRFWFCWFLAGIALFAALFGLQQVVRYLLILKWPERFVDFD